MNKSQSLNIVLGLALICFVSFYIGTKSASHTIVGEGPFELDRVAKKLLVLDDDDITYGNKDADIIFFEYSDLECPFCGRIHPVLQDIVSENKNFLWVYRHLPLPNHQTAFEGAIIAECVSTHQGNEAARSYIDSVFEFQGEGPSIALYRRLARAEGVTDSQIDKCIDDDSFESKKVVDQIKQAERLGINGTPGGYVVNKADKKKDPINVPGAVPREVLDQIIKEIQQ